MRTRRSFRHTLPALFLALTLALPSALPASAATRRAVLAQAGDEEIASYIADIRAEDPDIEDSFEEDSGAWETGYTGDTSTYFRAGQLHIAVDVEDTVLWSNSSTTGGDFYLEVETQQRDGPLDNQFGVVFRASSDEDSGNSYYLFSASSDGFYSFKKLVNNEWESLVEWTESDVIETGEESENLLGVLAEGNSFTLLINDYILEQVEDDSFAEGTLALAAGAFDEAGVDVAFDNFAVWLLGETEETPSLPVRLPERGERTTPEPEATEEPVDEPVEEPSEEAADEPATPEPDTSEEVATPEPEVTEETAEEPAVEPGEESAEARISAIRAEDPSYVEEFDEEPADWSPSLYEGLSYTVEDGALVIEVEEAGSLAWTLSDQRPTDFYMEVDATHLAGAEESEFGILFRYVDPQNFYMFALSAVGEYSLWMLQENEWQVLHEWTADDAIETGSAVANRMGLLAEGEQFTLLVNDTVLVEVSDDSLLTGAIGLTLGTFDEGDVSVAFDNMAVWDLGEAASDLPVADPDAPVEPSEEATGDAFPDATARIEEITGVEPTFSDDFRLDQAYWDMSLADNALFFYDQRSLHAEVSSANWIAWSVLRTDTETATDLTDFYAEVDLTFIQQPPGAAAGMVFRLQDSDNFYLYAVDPTGYYNLQKKSGGEWVELVAWTESDLIETGEEVTNRLGVLAEGSTLTLTLNGVVVAEVEDADLENGSLALMAEAFDSPNVEVAFDNFSLWDLAQ
jgi:hypothetical protein